MYLDSNGFIVYEPDQYLLSSAKAVFENRFNSSCALNSRTVYERMESRLAGIVGESVYQALFPLAKKSPDKDVPFDFYHDGLKIDVKCKFRTVAPKKNFEASFFAYQMGHRFQNVDRYVFMSTMEDFSKVWICGYIDKKDFMSRAVLWKRGQVDPSNGKVFHEDTYSVFYSQLNKYTLR